MSFGLIALLDDIAGIAQLAASSTKIALSQAAKAGSKSAAVVVDDMTVTPIFVQGFPASRELPMIWRIVKGSLRNKIFILLPSVIAVSAILPQAIFPALAIGALYLCYEGAEKILDILFHKSEGAQENKGVLDKSHILAENEKVNAAIQTDFVLSLEIAIVALSAVADQSIAVQAFAVAVSGLGITVLVYGTVALIVKADDIGLALVLNEKPVSSVIGIFKGRNADTKPTIADKVFHAATSRFGRGLVSVMPILLQALSMAGTAAMLWVGGGIIMHAIDSIGYHWLSTNTDKLIAFIGGLAHDSESIIEMSRALLDAVFGIIIGALIAITVKVFHVAQVSNK